MYLKTAKQSHAHYLVTNDYSSEMYKNVEGIKVLNDIGFCKELDSLSIIDKVASDKE